MGVVALPAMLDARLQEGPRARLHLRRRRPGDADPAERRLHHVRPDRRRLDRPALHRRHHPRADAGRALHRLHHRPLQARARARAAAPSAEELAMPLREKLALLQGADPAGAGRLQRARLALHGLGDADRGGRRRRRPARCSPRPGQPPAQLGRRARRRHRHDQGHGDALLAVLRLVGADRRLHAGRRHQADPGRDDQPAGRADGRDPDHDADLDHPRLLHRLDRHPAADRADLRAGRGRSSASTWSGSACCSA